MARDANHAPDACRAGGDATWAEWVHEAMGYGPDCDTQEFDADAIEAAYRAACAEAADQRAREAAAAWVEESPRHADDQYPW
jgi:hypothetical protein